MSARAAQNAIDATRSAAYGNAPKARVSEPGVSRRVLVSVATKAFGLTAALAVLAGSLGSVVRRGEEARREVRANALVTESIEAVAAFPYSSVRALDGAVWNDASTAATSEHRVELRVEARGDGWLQVSGQLVECRSGRVAKTFTTYRGKG